MRSDMINRVQAKWSKVSKQSLVGMKDDLTELVGMIQRAYGYTKDRAEREFHDFQLSIRPVLHPVRVTDTSPKR